MLRGELNAKRSDRLRDSAGGVQAKDLLARNRKRQERPERFGGAAFPWEDTASKRRTAFNLAMARWMAVSCRTAGAPTSPSASQRTMLADAVFATTERPLHRLPMAAYA